MLGNEESNFLSTGEIHSLSSLPSSSLENIFSTILNLLQSQAHVEYIAISNLDMMRVWITMAELTLQRSSGNPFSEAGFLHFLKISMHSMLKAAGVKV